MFKVTLNTNIHFNVKKDDDNNIFGMARTHEWNFYKYELKAHIGCVEIQKMPVDTNWLSLSQLTKEDRLARANFKKWTKISYISFIITYILSLIIAIWVENYDKN